MKINHTNSTKSTNKTSKKKSSSNVNSGQFSGLLKTQGAQETTTTEALTSINSLGSLLSLNDVNDHWDEFKQQYYQHGSKVLNLLDDIRDGYLTGEINAQKLDNMLNLINEKKVEMNDEHLKKIVEEIELRALVEKAKIEQGRQ